MEHNVSTHRLQPLNLAVHPSGGKMNPCKINGKQEYLCTFLSKGGKTYLGEEWCVSSLPP